MEITIPFNFKAREYQLPLLKAMDSGIKRAIYVCHRRAGKDKTAWNLTIKKALERVGTYYYFLPYYEQARKVIWDGIDSDGFRFIDHIPKELVKSITDKPMQVQLVNGSIIEVVGADRIDSIVGSNPIGVVFSEYSIMKENVWQFISPILAANGGWAIFIFTPRGTNHAWKLIQKHKDNKDWFVSILGVSDTGAVPPDVLEAEKLSLPREIYEQEYEVKFIDGGSQVFKNVERATHEDVRINPDQTHRYQIGVDLAKSLDFTVITVFDLMTFKVVEIDRFNQIDWNLQKAKIELYQHKYFKPLFVVDATGVGDPITEDLINAGLNVLPFKFTEQSRTDLLNNLSIKLQVPTISIPNNPLLIEELKSFQYELVGQKMKMLAPGHDDCFVKGTKILTDKGNINIEDIKVGDMVLTRQGFRQVEMTRNNPKFVINNIGLRGTPTHPIILADGREVELQNVSNQDKLHVWNKNTNQIEKLSFTEAKAIIDIQTQKEDNLEFTIGDMINGKATQYPYIDKFGKTTTIKSLKDILSTIKTRIHSITTSLIFNSWVRENIISTTTMIHKKKESVIMSIVKKLLSTLILYAHQNSVTGFAGKEIERVYNLQISEVNEYFANNILVHNCVMSLALSVWEIPQKPRGAIIDGQGLKYLIADFAEDRSINTEYY